MTSAKSSNPLVALFYAVADVVNEQLNHKRAVSINDVFLYLQDELDKAAQPQVAPDGTTMPAEEAGAFVLDVYAEADGIFAIITKSDGKLYKVPVTVADDNTITTGEYIEVSLEFAPTAGRQLSIKRTADGKYRWFAMPACTAVLNRSGEIDSTALFDKFVQFAERNGKYPELDFYHFGEQILLGKADWVARDGVGYCASGLFYDTPIAQAAIKALEADPSYWGLSIEYIYNVAPETIRSAEGIEIPVYNSGINRFISLLPENDAASILTSISTTQEKNRMNDKVKAALIKLVGDDPALLEEFASRLDGINRAASGMVQRNDNMTTTETHVMETSTPAPVAEVPTAPTAEARAVSPEDLQAILTSPEFEKRVMEIYAKAYAMQSGDAPAQAQTVEQAVEIPQPVPPAEVAALRGLVDGLQTSLTDLTTKISDLNKSRDASVQEVLNDLPSRIARQPIVRPRTTILPKQLQRAQVDMAEIAEQTLSTMGAN